MEAVNRPGIPIAEITVTVPEAIEVITGLTRSMPEMDMGAGTVLDMETAKGCLDSGAKFLTSPEFVLEVEEFAAGNNVVVSPGALTPAEVIRCLRAIVCVLAATFLLLSTPVMANRAQTAETLLQVKRVYVGSLGDKQGATELQDRLIRRLRKTRGIEVTALPSEADAIITGTGEIWLKGYVSTSPKPSPFNRQPVYDGYLSVELRGKNNAVLWSYRVTPSKFQWNDVPQDLVNRSARKLLAALHQHDGSR